MMIFGVAYHVIPRFTGRPLHSPRIARVHVWVANAGLLGMVSGFMLRYTQAMAGTIALRAGGIVSAVGVAFFIFNIWQTIGPAGMVSLSAGPAIKSQRR
jgi:cbb3-type cytochrome oxidase subunit 1